MLHLTKKHNSFKIFNFRGMGKNPQRILAYKTVKKEVFGRILEKAVKTFSFDALKISDFQMLCFF